MNNPFSQEAGQGGMIEFPSTDGVEAQTDDKWWVEAGPYPGTLISAEEGESKAGNAKITMKFEVDVGKSYNFNMYFNCSFHTPSTLERMARTMAALGVPSGAKLSLSELEGRRCICNVADDDYHLPKKQSKIDSLDVLEEKASDELPF